MCKGLFLEYIGKLLLQNTKDFLLIRFKKQHKVIDGQDVRNAKFSNTS